MQVKALEKDLRNLIKDDEDVELLEIIPGVCLITASTIRAFTDDIYRFSCAKKYAAYAGLVPWVQNSNMTTHYGHITKKGPTELRTAYVQVVMGMVRNKKITQGYRIMISYNHMKKEKGSGKSIIATSRKISTIVYTILKTREPFNPEKMALNKKYIDMRTTV